MFGVVRAGRVHLADADAPTPAHPGLLDRYRVIGLIGSAALALGGSAAGALPVRDPFAGLPLVRDLRAVEPIALAVAYMGLAVLVVAWLLLGRLVGTPAGPGRRSLLVTLVVWSAPLAVAPPMFSRDVYSYAAQGWLAQQGASPYFWGPGSLPDNPFLADVSALWAHTPAPYGPVSLQMAQWAVELGADRTVPTVLLLRLGAVTGVLLLVRYVPRLAAHCGVRCDAALWLGVLNPLVLLHVVSGAHNDGLLAGMVVAGLVLVLDRRPVAGTAVLALAVLVKAPAALALVFCVPVWAAQLGGRLRVPRAAASAAVVTVGVVAGVTWLTGYGYGWVSALQTPGTVRNWLSVTTLTGEAVALVVKWSGLSDHTDEAVAVFRGAGGVVAMLVCLVLLHRVDRHRLVAGLGVALAAVVALGPVVQPWYLLWAVPLLAAGATGERIRRVAVIGSAVLAMVLMPQGGTVGVHAIVQAVLAAAAVAGAAVVFELLPRPVRPPVAASRRG